MFDIIIAIIFVVISFFVPVFLIAWDKNDGYGKT